MATKIKKVDRAAAELLGAEIKAAIDAIAKKHGMVVTYKGSRFTENTWTPKIEFACTETVRGGVAIDLAARARWERGVFRHKHLTAAMFGKVFLFGGAEYRVADYKSRARKFPVVAIRVSDGARFKMAAETVGFALVRMVG